MKKKKLKKTLKYLKKRIKITDKILSEYLSGELLRENIAGQTKPHLTRALASLRFMTAKKENPGKGAKATNIHYDEDFPLYEDAEGEQINDDVSLLEKYVEYLKNPLKRQDKNTTLNSTSRDDDNLSLVSCPPFVSDYLEHSAKLLSKLEDDKIKADLAKYVTDEKETSPELTEVESPPLNQCGALSQPVLSKFNEVTISTSKFSAEQLKTLNFSLDNVAEIITAKLRDGLRTFIFFHNTRVYLERGIVGGEYIWITKLLPCPPYIIESDNNTNIINAIGFGYYYWAGAAAGDELLILQSKHTSLRYILHRDDDWVYSNIPQDWQKTPKENTILLNHPKLYPPEQTIHSFLWTSVLYSEKYGQFVVFDERCKSCLIVKIDKDNSGNIVNSCEKNLTRKIWSFINIQDGFNPELLKWHNYQYVADLKRYIAFDTSGQYIVASSDRVEELNTLEDVLTLEWVSYNFLNYGDDIRLSKLNLKNPIVYGSSIFYLGHDNSKLVQVILESILSKDIQKIYVHMDESQHLSRWTGTYTITNQYAIGSYAKYGQLVLLTNKDNYYKCVQTSCMPLSPETALPITIGRHSSGKFNDEEVLKVASIPIQSEDGRLHSGLVAVTSHGIYQKESI